MFVQVTAKNVGVFFWDTVYIVLNNVVWCHWKKLIHLNCMGFTSIAYSFGLLSCWKWSVIRLFFSSFRDRSLNTVHWCDWHKCKHGNATSNNSHFSSFRGMPYSSVLLTADFGSHWLITEKISLATVCYISVNHHPAFIIIPTHIMLIQGLSHMIDKHPWLSTRTSTTRLSITFLCDLLCNQSRNVDQISGGSDNSDISMIIFVFLF